MSEDRCPVCEADLGCWYCHPHEPDRNSEMCGGPCEACIERRGLKAEIERLRKIIDELRKIIDEGTRSLYCYECGGHCVRFVGQGLEVTDE